MSLLEIIAAFWLAFGIFFYITGVVGVIRLPDAFSRLHASGKVATLGLFGLLLGVGFINTGSILKLFTLGLFVAVTAPVATHAIAKADKEYSVRQQVARDSSISGEGDQEIIKSTQEQQIATTNSDTEDVPELAEAES
ncbi:MAG: monovalent cation/H(+) antiporter subunit G [Chloroflexota bacterium]